MGAPELGDVVVEEEKIDMDGEVLEALGSGMFRVTLENGGHSVPAYTSARMRTWRAGDRESCAVGSR